MPSWLTMARRASYSGEKMKDEVTDLGDGKYNHHFTFEPKIDKRDLYFTAFMYFILGAVVGFVLLPLVI